MLDSGDPVKVGPVPTGHFQPRGLVRPVGTGPTDSLRWVVPGTMRGLPSDRQVLS